MGPASLAPSWQTIAPGDLLQREVTASGRPVTAIAAAVSRHIEIERP
jgi:hypothetical protein